MIEKEESYKFYENTGEKPEDKDLYDQGLYKQIGKPPPAPPPTDINLEKAKEPSNIAQIKQPATSSTDNKKKDDIKSGKESRLFLVIPVWHWKLLFCVIKILQF